MLIVQLKRFGNRWIERVGDKCQEKSIIKTSSNRTSSISKNARFCWSITQWWLSSSAYRKQRWSGCHLQIEYHDLSISGIVWDGTCLVCWSGSNLDAREDSSTIVPFDSNKKGYDNGNMHFFETWVWSYASIRWSQIYQTAKRNSRGTWQRHHHRFDLLGL